MLTVCIRTGANIKNWNIAKGDRFWYRNQKHELKIKCQKAPGQDVSSISWICYVKASAASQV